MRVYVGGLGCGVTEENLRKIFESLGDIETIDIIRTKGRSFAYVDFIPSSDHSLSKLFSIYNGCAWKGGRLRLEKAKEHYLVRLGREWAEDAQLSAFNNVADSNPTSDTTKPNKIIPQNKQLNIFFPRLRKVKSLPFSGTGKHKYSFPRGVEPSLPVHFCDCEEHSVPVVMNNGKDKSKFDLENQSDGINEEELKIMHSVMNKLFERENISNSEHSIGPGKRGDGPDNSVKLIDHLQIDETKGESEPDEADEDGLILNVVTSTSNRVPLWDTRKETTSKIQESRYTRAAKDGPVQDVEKEQKNNIGLRNKKRRSTIAAKIDANELLSAAPTATGSTQISSNDLRTSEGGQSVDQKSRIQKPTSSSQKSSWRALVGDTDNSAFSLSQILAATSENTDILKSDSPNMSNISNSNNKGLTKDEDIKGKSSETEMVLMLDESQPTKQTTDSNKKSGRGAAWLQKCSWTQLVGEKDNRSFSIAQILSGTTLEKQLQTKQHNTEKVTSLACRENNDFIKQDNNNVSAGDGKSAASSIGKEVKKKQLSVMDSNQASAEILERLSPEPRPGVDAKIGETCSFMRSAASLKEWAKTKATLSGSLKRKSSSLV